MMHDRKSRALMTEMNEKYIDLRDSLEDAFSAFEDLQSDIEATLEAVSDSLESIRDGLNGVDRAFRMFQRHMRSRKLESIFRSYPLEPGEQLVIPPDSILFSDELPFPEDEIEVAKTKDFDAINAF